MNSNQFDVIIVGGRPAGSTLATRLGLQGVRVLLVDRATFPSLPPISSPIIYASTMAMLDEIGADEKKYAHNTPRIRKVVSEAKDNYRGVGQIPMDRGRDYAYAVDRERFDATLWERAASLPSVTALQGFSVLDLLRNGERVTGIIGKPKDGVQQEFHADVVVGADGRSSLVARKVGAVEYNVHETNPVTYYYAYWKALTPYDIVEPLALTHGEFEGFGYLIMDSADGTTAITVGGYSPAFDAIPHESVEDLYLQILKRAPRIWDRLKNAERVTTVRGLKNVPNFYRQPFGNGWALVGDAAHHKDPLGGQGIYDAVFGARAFANEYLAFRGGEAWDVAMERYKAGLEAETLATYRNTLAATSNYGPSNALFQMLGRYVCEDPDFITRMVRVPTRMIQPEKAADPQLVVRTLARGLAGDVRRRVVGGTSPAAVPPLPGQKQTTASSTPRMGCLGWMLLIPVMGAVGVFRRR